MSVTLEFPVASRRGENPKENPGLFGPRPRLTVGLVNNMPDAAMSATERQFIGLLEHSGGDYDIRLRLFALDAVARSEQAKRAMDGRYHRADALFSLRHDALIVTGAEPRAPTLHEEPYWRELIAVFDWARAQTGSTLFLCLAAHAAVLHWNSIGRVPLPRKLTGAYAVSVAQDHRITEGLPRVIPMPHSRLNGLDDLALRANGYKPLLWSEETGGDLFVKEDHSLLVLLQGHLEYEADTLAREFRRDLCRYAAGGCDMPPALPHNYFHGDLRERAHSLVERTQRERRPDVAEQFSLDALDGQVRANWQSHARRFYGNWLSLIAERSENSERAFDPRAAMSLPSHVAPFCAPGVAWRRQSVPREQEDRVLAGARTGR